MCKTRVTDKPIKTFLGLATLCLLTACQSDTCSISGEAPLMNDGDVILLVKNLEADKPDIDSLIVSNGRFHAEGKIDSSQLCRLYPADHPQEDIYFFIEPGNIYIELSPNGLQPRVSGTETNNHWQALNDTIAVYDSRIRHLFRLANDSNHTRKLAMEMDHLYSELTLRIKQTALENKENALGRFIDSHFKSR